MNHMQPLLKSKSNMFFAGLYVFIKLDPNRGSAQNAQADAALHTDGNKV